MSYADRLSTEIQTILNEQDDAAEWRADALAMLVIGLHKDGVLEGEPGDFWRHCGYCHVRDQVRRAINARAAKPADSDDGQERLPLPGFKRLQRRYLVERDGEQVGVLVWSMTDEEITVKVKEYRVHARACFEHADELERFRTQREKQQTAAD